METLALSSLFAADLLTVDALVPERVRTGFPF